MADMVPAHGWNRVQNTSVWESTKLLFLGSLVVFLVNITLGFANVVTTGEIPHWQLLTHLHGGTLGWVTLSAIGFTVWLFTGNRAVSETYERRVRWLARAAVLIAASYVTSFGLSFSLTGNAYYLLPVFGTGMLLVIWATALLALTQLRHQPVVRTVHLLVAGGFTLASFGAIMGVLLGLQYAIGALPLPAGIPSKGAHGGPMDVYAILIGLALVEFLVTRGDVSEWTWAGFLQAAVFTAAGFALFTGIEALGAVGSILGFIVGPVIFFARIGWRAVTTNPMRGDEAAWAFFAPLWLLVFIGGMLAGIGGLFPEGAEWPFTIIFHAYFIGFITNGLFGLYAHRTSDSSVRQGWAEPGAMWLMNIGLITFAATEIALGERYGAVVMGLGVLLAVGTMAHRLLDESPAERATGQPTETTTD